MKNSDNHEPSGGTEEIDFAQLADGSLVEMIESPEDPSETRFAVCKGKEIMFTNEVERAGKLLRPIPRNVGYLRHVHLPNGIAPYHSIRALLERINRLLTQCLDVGDLERILLAAFVVATWFIDRLPIAPYLALVGLPGSGKSTVLKVLSLVCRRSLITADISSAAFYQVCDRLTPTLLIDETATAGDRKTLFHLLRSGTSRDTVALRRNQAFKAFGAKAFTFVELPHDAALISRCAIIRLQESRRIDLSRSTDLGIIAEAEALKRQLLQYRLESLNTVSLSPTPGDDKLISRNRDLYRAFAIASEPWRGILVKIFTQQESLTREPLFPTHMAVLRHLYRHIHGPMEAGAECGTIKDLTDLINRGLALLQESMRLNPRQVGAVLTTFGIARRKRSAQGWKVQLTAQDHKRIHELVDTYGIDNDAFWPTFQTYKYCKLCKDMTHHFYGSSS